MREMKDHLVKRIGTAHKDNGFPVKEVICFDSHSQQKLAEELSIDYFTKPTEQCRNWVDWLEMNRLRSEGVKFARITLNADDIYVIPRGVVHQFHTVSAVASIAWHIRLKQYYAESGNFVAYPFMLDNNALEQENELMKSKKPATKNVRKIVKAAKKLRESSKEDGGEMRGGEKKDADKVKKPVDKKSTETNSEHREKSVKRKIDEVSKIDRPTVLVFGNMASAVEKDLRIKKLEAKPKVVAKEIVKFEPVEGEKVSWFAMENVFMIRKKQFPPPPALNFRIPLPKRHLLQIRRTPPHHGHQTTYL